MLHDKNDRNNTANNTSETISSRPPHKQTNTNGRINASQSEEERGTISSTEADLEDVNFVVSKDNMPIERPSDAEWNAGDAREPHGGASPSNDREMPHTIPRPAFPHARGATEEEMEEGDQREGSWPPAPPFPPFAADGVLDRLPAKPWVPIPSDDAPKASFTRIPSSVVEGSSAPLGSSPSASTSAGSAVFPSIPVPLSSTTTAKPLLPTTTTTTFLDGHGGAEMSLDAASVRLRSLSSSAVSSASQHHLGTSSVRSPSKESIGMHDTSVPPSHDGMRSAAPSTPPYPLTSFSSSSLEETLPLEHSMRSTDTTQERVEKGVVLWPTRPYSTRFGEAVRSREGDASTAKEKVEEEEEEDEGCHTSEPSGGKEGTTALFLTGNAVQEEGPKAKKTRHPPSEHESEEDMERVEEGCITPFPLHSPARPLMDGSAAEKQEGRNRGIMPRSIFPRAGTPVSTAVGSLSSSASPRPSVLSFGSPRFPPASSSVLPLDPASAEWTDSMDETRDSQAARGSGKYTMADTMASPRRHGSALPPPPSASPSGSLSTHGSEKKRGTKKGGGGGKQLEEEAPITIAGVNLEDPRRKRLKKVSHYILGPLLGEGMYGVVRDAIDIAATPQCVTSKKSGWRGGGEGGNTNTTPYGSGTVSNASLWDTSSPTPHASKGTFRRDDSRSSVPASTMQVEAMRSGTPGSGGGGSGRSGRGVGSTSSLVPAYPGHQQFHRCAVKMMTVPQETVSKHKSLMTGGKRRTAAHSNRAALLRAAFQKEVENLQRFHCPYIMRAMDLFSRYGKEYMVLPIAICCLQEFIVQRRQYAMAGQEWSALGEERPMRRDERADEPFRRALHDGPPPPNACRPRAYTGEKAVPVGSFGRRPHAHRGPQGRRSRDLSDSEAVRGRRRHHRHRPPFVDAAWRDRSCTPEAPKEKENEAYRGDRNAWCAKEDTVIGTVVRHCRKTSTSASASCTSSCSSSSYTSSCSSSSFASSSVSSASWSSRTSSTSSSRSVSSSGSHRSYRMACADACSTSSHLSGSTSMTDALTSPASLELLPVITTSSSLSFSPRDFTQSGAGGGALTESTPRSRRATGQSGAERFPLPPSGDWASGSGSDGSARRRDRMRPPRTTLPPGTTFLLGADPQGEREGHEMRENVRGTHSILPCSSSSSSSPRYRSSGVPPQKDPTHVLFPSSPRNSTAVLASPSTSKESGRHGCGASLSKRSSPIAGRPTTGTASPRYGHKPTRQPLRSLFSATFIKGAFYQILSAVTYLHQQNLAHNDIKPSNILLFEDGTLRLTDLAGVSAHYKDQGTPLFASPELARYYYGCGTDMDPIPTTPAAMNMTGLIATPTQAIPSPSSSSALLASTTTASPSRSHPDAVASLVPPLALSSSTGGLQTTQEAPDTSTLEKERTVAASTASLQPTGQVEEEQMPSFRVQGEGKETRKETDGDDVVEVDAKACDMWCCGLVLYTMVTGKPGPLPIQLSYDSFHHDTCTEGQSFPMNRFQLYRFIADQKTPVNLDDIPHFRTVSSPTKEKSEPHTSHMTITTEGKEKEEKIAKGNNAAGSLRDLLAGLLELDPGKRLTAEQALKHPWMELKFIRRGGGGKHTATTPTAGTEEQGEAGPAASPHRGHHHHHRHHHHHPPRHGALDPEHASPQKNTPEPLYNDTKDVTRGRKAKQNDEKNRTRKEVGEVERRRKEEWKTNRFLPLASLATDDIVVSSHDIIALSNMEAEDSMNYAIQRQVASRVLASHHFKAMIVKDKQRHLQFVADCCHTLGIPIPHEILLPSSSSANNRTAGDWTTGTGNPTILGEGGDPVAMTTSASGNGVSDRSGKPKGTDASKGVVGRTEMDTPTNKPACDGRNNHTHSTWDPNTANNNMHHHDGHSDEEESAMAAEEPAMGKVVRDGYCPSVMPPGCIQSDLFLPESEADYYERKNAMPEFDIRSLLDQDDVPPEVLWSLPSVPPRSGSFSYLAPRFSRTYPIKVQQMEEYLHNVLMVELGYRTKPDPFYVAERIGPISFDGEEEEEGEDEDEEESEAMYASISHRMKKGYPDASKETKKGTWTMPIVATAPFSPLPKDDAGRQDFPAMTTAVVNSVASSLISAEWSRSPTPACEVMPMGERISAVSTENSFSDTVSVRTQESTIGVDKMDKKKQDTILEGRKEKKNGDEIKTKKDLSALGSIPSHSSLGTHRDPTAVAAEVVARDELSSPPCKNVVKKPVVPNSFFTRPHLTPAKSDLPASSSFLSLSQKIGKGGEERGGTISHMNNNSGILSLQRASTNNSFTSFQSGSSTMSYSVLPVPEEKENQTESQQAAPCGTPPRRVKDENDRNGKRKKKGNNSGSSSKNSNNGMNPAQRAVDARRIQESSRCFCGLV